MKKGSLFLAFLGVFSIASLTSCAEDSKTSNTITENTNQITTTETTTKDNNTTTKTTTEKKTYQIEDNALSEKVYNEFLESYPNLTYDDFRYDGSATYSNNTATFTYDLSTIELNNEAFVSKTIRIGNKETYSKYINNEWLKLEEYSYYNGEKRTMYSLVLDQNDNMYSKFEQTCDDKGNYLTSIYYKYENDTWVLKTKIEYTYDDAGNELSEISKKYQDGAWVIEDEKEWTYDEDGNILTDIRISYTDGTEIGEKRKYSYEIFSNGKIVTEIDSRDDNGTWTYDRKLVMKYENDVMFEMETYNYQDGAWVKA